MNPLSDECSSPEHPKTWPQVLLFPEGTTTNAKSLIQFKAGSFRVCLSYIYNLRLPLKIAILRFFEKNFVENFFVLHTEKKLGQLLKFFDDAKLFIFLFFKLQAGTPVQPIVIRRDKNKWDTLTWTKGCSFIASFWSTICQFNTKIEVFDY